MLANDTATLVYLAGQNVITPHTWTSRADRLERPDRLIFDLDPSKDDFAEVRATARALGDLLRDLGPGAARHDHRLARPPRDRPAAADRRVPGGAGLRARRGGDAGRGVTRTR